MGENKNGATSQISIKHGVVTKKVVNFTQYDTFQREIYWFTHFNHRGYKWSPKLISVNPKQKILQTEFAGERIRRENAPINWENQLKEILGDLSKENIFHNDIKSEDLLVKKGKLSLIDYGWMSIGKDWSCGGKFNGCEKPVNKYPDEKAVERIREHLGKMNIVTEERLKKFVEVLQQTFQKEGGVWDGKEILNIIWGLVFF